MSGEAFSGSAAPGRTIRIPGLDCAVEVRHAPRARRLALKLSQTERAAVLTVPPRVADDEAGRFLDRHIGWLKAHIERLPRSVPFVDGAIIPYRGMAHRIRFVGAVRYRGVIWREPTEVAPLGYFGTESFEACTLPALCVTGGEVHAPRRLEAWLRAEAKSDIARRTSLYAARLACRPRRVSVRDQATRWGSCSSSGTLSYSWRLIFAPDPIRDYVAAHEVAHLREMNHGPRFWRLVSDCIPEMDTHRSWLKQHGVALHCFGRADDTRAVA